MAGAFLRTYGGGGWRPAYDGGGNDGVWLARRGVAVLK